jgi:hypothetical protein
MDAVRPKIGTLTTAAQSPDAFLNDLVGVLRRDRGLAKSGQTNCRNLAQRLASILWNGAVSARNRREEYDLEVWRETARSQADRADALARQARQLLNSLRRADPVIRGAVDRGFLPRGPAQGPPPSNLAELMSWGTGWSAAVQVRRPLEQLAREAAEWASKAHQEGKRPRGPQRSRTRDRLSAWVAVQLAHAGVRPTSAKRGTFARVLPAVQIVAGFPERALEQMERDVRRALKHPTVVDYLSALRTRRPNSR